MAIEKYHDRTRTDLRDYLSYMIEEQLKGLYAEG